MSAFATQEKVLLSILQKKLSPGLYEYAERELQSFYKKCYWEFDERAAHTDREGQPRLIRYDRFGEEVSEVWVNEGYKNTVRDTYNTGIVGYNHKAIPELEEKGNYLYSYAQGYILSQIEPGFYCPVTLTMAVAYLLDHFADEELKERFLPHVLSTGESELFEGATFLTERQGGSDVGANEVRAVEAGERYRLFGEKYFASNAGQAGVAAVLARLEGAPEGTSGLSLFIVPWKKEDGSLNGVRIRRLKDKLGVRAVPSGEVEFDGAEAYLVGNPDRGFYYMMEALNLSRICNSTASLGIMKRALKEGYEYASSRESFGKYLIDFPMVQETVVQLQARFEVQLSALFESIELFERVASGDVDISLDEIALNRLYIALIKARTAEEAIDFSHTAIELHGGNGYIEDFVTPRLLRDAQVLTVWEGTENILALEVMRLIKKFNVHQLFFDDLINRMTIGTDSHAAEQINEKIQSLKDMLVKLTSLSEDHQTYHARKIARRMADLLMVVHAYERAETEREKAIADIFRMSLWEKDELDEGILCVESFGLIMD
ncbi:acyl-CoA dehydrogenase family protein [Jeotgalibacillus proteolyticus]|uniref:Isovaleryl-CoA dehydrogenase n=1 Tax=Jeotgalibacillus proteolyticus TaxID=2082395 RepID=A0A2S5G8R8_9BACL|nr:acyl-CoA dehydrogenase family protein [Jeotgalibacillus proteolyticus]PPA69323.1 isovaleryl-CoA dehydrogenase [Jeotgalibacillus proteolyticus]